MPAPNIFDSPRGYLTWAARTKPAIFWSCVVGLIGPIMAFTVPGIRERLGDPPRPMIPLTYPIPKGPRNIPSGYDD